MVDRQRSRRLAGSFRALFANWPFPDVPLRVGLCCRPRRGPRTRRLRGGAAPARPGLRFVRGHCGSFVLGSADGSDESHMKVAYCLGSQPPIRTG
jgi:hypothetical protein